MLNFLPANFWLLIGSYFRSGYFKNNLSINFVSKSFYLNSALDILRLMKWSLGGLYSLKRGANFWNALSSTPYLVKYLIAGYKCIRVYLRKYILSSKTMWVNNCENQLKFTKIRTGEILSEFIIIKFLNLKW